MVDIDILIKFFLMLIRAFNEPINVIFRIYVHSFVEIVHQIANHHHPNHKLSDPPTLPIET